MDFCVSVLWHQPLSQMKEAADAYANYREALKRRANSRWRTYADTLDRWARFWVPATYMIIWISLSQLQLSDRYQGVINETRAADLHVARVDRAMLDGVMQIDGTYGSYVGMTGWLNAMHVNWLYTKTAASNGWIVNWVLVAVFIAVLFAIMLWTWVRCEVRRMRNEKIHKSRSAGKSAEEDESRRALSRSRLGTLRRAETKVLNQVRLGSPIHQA